MSFTSNLKKALTSVDAAALIPYDLENMLNEELIRLQPLTELLPVLQAEGKTHEYQVRTSHPQGWFEGETTPFAPKKGTYVRKSVVLKISRIWGSVTGFSRAVTEEFIDALVTEIEGSVQGMADLIEYGVLFGCADDKTFTGDSYQFTGFLPILYADAPECVFSGGNAKISLEMMDELLATQTKWRQTVRDPRLWFMDVRMKQVVDGLQSKVQLPLQTVELADGRIVMAAYGGAPILETDYLTSESGNSPALTSALASGGSLVDATAYQHRIASVTVYGESVASALSTARTPGTGNNTINLTWTADPDAVLYMIFRKTSTGDPHLIDIIPALTYDADGTVNGVIESYSDNGSKTPITQVLPLETGQRQVLLINRNPNRGAAFIGKIDDMGSPMDNLMSFVELARVKDTWDYMIKSYLSLRHKYPNLISVLRNVKLV